MFAHMDKSQIRPWVKVWLADQRKRMGLSQEKAAHKAGVGIGVVRSAEQVGSPPDLHHFLSLVLAYEAEGALVNQIREWREASRQPNGGESVAPKNGRGATVEPRPELQPPTKPARGRGTKGSTARPSKGKLDSADPGSPRGRR